MAELRTALTDLRMAQARIDDALMRHALRRGATVAEGEDIAALRWALRDAVSAISFVCEAALGKGA